jgi:nicotinamide-nucleotide amidase
MAQGALARSPATVAVAVTGVLGPDPDEDNNPPGLLHFATCRKGFGPLLSNLQITDANPDTVRRCAVEEALRLLLRAASV